MLLLLIFPVIIPHHSLMQNPKRASFFFLIVKCQVALQSGSPTHNHCIPSSHYVMSVSLCRCSVFASKPAITLVQDSYVCLLFFPVFHLQLLEGLQSADLMTFCPHVACGLVAMATLRNQKVEFVAFHLCVFVGKKSILDKQRNRMRY